jgi:hypothetical protein
MFHYRFTDNVTREGLPGTLPEPFGKPGCQVFCLPNYRLGAGRKARPENCEEPSVKARDRCAALRPHNTESKLGW